MWTDGVVVDPPRLDDAASFAKPVEQMLVDARAGRSAITYRIFRTFDFAGGSFQSERTEDGRERRHADGERSPHR